MGVLAVSATLDNRADECGYLFTDGDELKNRFPYSRRWNERV